MQEEYKLDSIKSSRFNFDGGKLSSESGMLLFHEYVKKRGILKLLQEKYAEDRQGIYKHEKPNLLYQQIQRIIAGYTSNNVVSFLQHDPVYAKINEQTGMASSSTVCRWGQKLDSFDSLKLQSIHNDLVAIYYQQKNPEKIIIDIDTTYDPASAKLEGVGFNAHYKQVGYNPMVAFDRVSGLPLRGNLRPGEKYCNQEADTFLESIFQNLPNENFLKKGIYCCGDSGFACPSVYSTCEESNINYVIKLKQNNILSDIVNKYCVDNKISACSGTTQIYYFGSLYQAQSWDKMRRVVFKIIIPADELFPVYQAIVTNDMEMSAEEVFDFYNDRAICENWIEEGKNGFSWDHLSLKKFEANQARFIIFLIAMTIFRLFQLDTMDNLWLKKTVQTIRLQLFRVACKLVLGGRTFCFKISSSFVFKDIFIEIYKRIQGLTWAFAT